MWKIDRFIWNIRNLISWIPVLWNNFDWDYAFLQDVLHYKLTRMSKFFKTDAIVGDAQSVALEIDRCIWLLDQLRNEKYEDECMEVFYNQYPTIWDDRFEERMVDGKLHTCMKEFTEEQRQLFMECHLNAEKQRSEYNNELFDMLKNRLNCWWD